MQTTHVPIADIGKKNPHLAEVGKIAADGLWRNNPALVQLLGLCPLLGVTGSLINGLGLGLATTFVLMVSNLVVSLIRHLIATEIRIPVFVIIIAAAVTVLELLMQAFFYDLYLVLGIFLPLITTNCIIIGRAEAFAVKNHWFKSLLDAFFMGLGFCAVLVVLGALREVIGSGTLLAGADALFGAAAQNWQITLLDDYGGFLLAILPPGAFIGMGLLLAARNWLKRA